MDKRKAILGSGAAVLVLVAAAWAFGLFGGTDPAVAKLQDIGDQMNDPNLSEAQRGQLRGQLRQQMQTLTDDQRRAYFNANRGRWEAQSAQRMNQFFAMPKADQQKRLDEIINRMNQPRDSQRQASGRGQSDGRGGRSMSEAQREERSKRRLDSSSPKQRAQLTAFRQMLDQRAQQRGIKLGDGWGRRG